jgi:hypothetical protein
MSNLDIASYNRQGKVFVAANVSAKSVIAVTTGMTGVILYNPVGSNKKLIIADASFVWTTAPAAVHNIGLALAAPNPTVPSSLTAIGSGVLAADGSGNAGSAVARAYDAATLPVAPVIVRWMGGAVYGSGVGESPYSIMDHVDGSIILVPGAVMTFAAVTTTAVGMGSVTWIEVPA